MPKAILLGQTNRIATPKRHLLYPTIDVVLADTVQNTVCAKVDQTFPMYEHQADIAMVRALWTAITTITGETDITETATVEVHHRTTDVEAREMNILVKETDVTMITMLTEAVQEVIAETEVEIGDGIVDVTERRGLAGIVDPEKDTRKVETDLEKGSETGPDLDLVKDPGRGSEIEIGVDLAIELETEIDLATGEIDTAKITDLVDAAAKVRITGVMTMGKKEALARRYQSQTTDRMKELRIQENVVAEVEAGSEAERAEG